jgi:hypothetical protein
MPYNRPGPGVYVTNGATAITHGLPCTVANFVGVAVKQQAQPWTAGFQSPAMIQPNEPFYMITKGVVQVPSTGLTTPTKGEAVYVNPDGSLAATGTVKFGRITEVGGNRGTPPNSVRIDLDAKDSF